MKKYIISKSGFTLLELLATLAISTLLIGVFYGVLTTTFKYNNKTQSHINLRQEANLIITQLRQQHQGEEYNLCYDQLQHSENVTMEILKINDLNLNSTQCKKIDPSKDLVVQFTVSDDQNNDFEIDTVIEAKQKSGSSIPIVIEKPTPISGIFDFLKNENIFVYGSNIGNFNNLEMFHDDEETGTIVINNDNPSDQVFNNNTKILVENIYIDKQGEEVVLGNNTILGKTGLTEIVSIKGKNVTVNNNAEIIGKKVFIEGDVVVDNNSPIKADEIYIDGKLTLRNNAEIIGRKVFISWDVILGNNAVINADENYIGGKITLGNNAKIYGVMKDFENIVMPVHPTIGTPTFREKNWYIANEYDVIGGNLHNGKKVYAEGSYSTYQKHSDFENVVIVSKKDINIEVSSLTGVLIAPNGKVVFEGNDFEGVVIAKNGFYTSNNAEITFKNIDDYFNDASEFPLK